MKVANIVMAIFGTVGFILWFAILFHFHGTYWWEVIKFFTGIGFGISWGAAIFTWARIIKGL